MKYTVNKKQSENINKLFSHHAPKDNQVERYIALRAKFQELAHFIYTVAPAGAEADRVVEDLSIVLMKVNAVIARNE